MRAIINCAVKTFIKSLFVAFLFLFFHNDGFASSHASVRHSIAMFGEPRYRAGFSHFDYVNPRAPRGGVLKFSQLGTFDSLNPLAPIGVSAFGVRELVYESLMTRSLDEPFTLYGLLAEKVQVAADRKSVIWWLHPRATFADGSPVRVEDIIFSTETLRELGRPNHRFYYRHIVRMEKIEKRAIRFTFDESSNWEMPLIIGLMPIISKKHWTRHRFGKERARTPLGSGPYRVGEIEFGKRIVYTRDKNYWGKDLAVNRGRYNFNRIEIDYYRDNSARFEAFKAGAFDFFEETSPTRWAKGYQFSRLKRGEVVKRQFSLKTPAPMWAIAFNTRRALFKNNDVRQALALTFDGGWVNKNLFFSLWQRSYSFWGRSSLAGNSPKASEASLRERKRKAFALFQKAGWQIKNNKLMQKNGEVFTFTILVKTRLNERLALVWGRQLKSFGIQADIRFIDDSQFERRKQNYDYDVIFAHWFMSLSPGNEQAYYWSSEAAQTKGSRNYAGVRAREIDGLVKQISDARTRDGLERSVKRLDRLLLRGHYVIPLFFAEKQWLVMDKRLKTPRKNNFYGYRIDTLWEAN